MRIILTIIFFHLSLTTFAQRDKRTYNHNTIGWYMYFGDHAITKKLGIHTEYQFRRIDIIKYWQQSLARVGVNYNLNEKAMLTGGYAFISTFPYGENPIAATGYPFPEHRAYQQLIFKNPIGRFDVSHRYRLEQRWLGILLPGKGHKISEWRYVNRARYMLRIAFPLKGNTLEDKEPYLAVYDEILIGFGKNLRSNFFDQNRLYGAIGYKVNKQLKVEIGFLNQAVQQGNGTVFEFNNGLQVSIFHNMDFTTKNVFEGGD